MRNGIYIEPYASVTDRSMTKELMVDLVNCSLSREKYEDRSALQQTAVEKTERDIDEHGLGEAPISEFVNKLGGEY